MKRLLIIVIICCLAAWVGSCAAGYAVVHAGGGPGVTTVFVLRDLSLMLFALYTLIVAIIGIALFGGLAWAIGRFGGKAVAGVQWGGRWVYRGEGWVNQGIERGVVRPLAHTAQALTTGTTMARALAAQTPQPAVVRRYPFAATRTLTSFVRQLSRSATLAASDAPNRLQLQTPVIPAKPSGPVVSGATAAAAVPPSSVEPHGASQARGTRIG